MLKGLKNLALAATIPFVMGGCAFISSFTTEEIVGLITLGAGYAGYVGYKPKSDLEIYAQELHRRDFKDKEKFPKGYDQGSSIGMEFQYRDKRCLFLYGNHRGEIWLPFLRLNKERIGNEEYNFRKKKYLYTDGIEIYKRKELTEVCLEIDSNSTNGNNDNVAHPKEIMARLEEVLPGATMESLKLDLKNRFS